MRDHYFKLFHRNLLKNKSSFLLNLAGLTLGIACWLFTLLFVFYEKSYDKYDVNSNRICRIVADVHSGGNETRVAYAFGFLSQQMPKRFPEIEKMARFNKFDGRAGIRRAVSGAGGGSADGAAGGTAGREPIPLTDLYYADPEVFDLFNYPLIAGDAQTCLTDPNSLVLTASTARQIFGTTPAMNKTVTLNGKLLKVTGVMKDQPGNSDLRFNALISLATVPKENALGWVYEYILFKNAAAEKGFQVKLDEFTKQIVNPEVGADASTNFNFILQPLPAIHFSPYRQFDTPKGNRIYVNIFLVTGLLILLIACTNSINLTIVQSFSRVMEVTIRKIYGANRTQLVLRHVVESVMTGMVATILAFFVVWLLLPGYGMAVNRVFSLTDLLNSNMLAAMVSALIVLGAGGAVYTGYYLNKVQLADTLRSKSTKIRSLKTLPRLVLGFQFIISIGMFIAAISVFRQVRYFKDTPLGFNPDNVMVIDLPQEVEAAAGEKAASGEKYLRNTLRTDPNIIMTSFCSATALPGNDVDVDVMEYRENGIKVKKTINHIDVDANYFSLLQIPIIRGTAFHDTRDSTARNFAIVSTGFARKAGWANPIGEVITAVDRKATVVGVVPEFHFSSLHSPILPLVIFQEPEASAYLLIRTQQNKTIAALDDLRSDWKKAFPETPFYYSFLDEHLMQQYQDDNNLLTLLLILTSLMIAISCIGLVAYVSFLLRLARTDIAVRRIVGASFSHIYTLYIRQFIYLLLIALAVAAPVTWLLLKKWLDQFAYHIYPRPVDLVIAPVSIGALVGLIMLRYARQSVSVNPGQVLREN
jgi:putative ABC transport system permease protein